MKNETPDVTATLEENVRTVVEEGRDVQEKVRQLTLRIISGRSLDIASVRETASAVLRGARAGFKEAAERSSAQADVAREHVREAVKGLDVALSQFAEAAKLSLEEAAGRAQKYSKDDLTRAREDLSRLETTFVDTLQTSASTAKDAAGDIFRDLAAHARTHGSAIGTQLKDTLSVFARHIGSAGREQVGAGLHLARNTADIMRQIAAGVLKGLAERMQPGESKEKRE